MTQYSAFHVFAMGVLLISIHHLHQVFIQGMTPSLLLELLPYLLILNFWSKLKDMIRGTLVLLFGMLELELTIFTHIPALFSEGLGRTTITPILFDIGAVSIVVAAIMVYQTWHDNREKEKLNNTGAL